MALVEIHRRAEPFVKAPRGEWPGRGDWRLFTFEESGRGEAPLRAGVGVAGAGLGSGEGRISLSGWGGRGEARRGRRRRTRRGGEEAEQKCLHPHQAAAGEVRLRRI